MADAIDSLRPALLAAASQLGLELLDPQADSLLRYLRLLQHWNGAYNLTAVRDPTQMLTQHIADCLAVIPPLRRQVQATPFRLLDVGSGGGLPGAVIAILNPAVQVTCVDSVGKKAAFVQQVAAELHLSNLRSRHARAEAMEGEPFDVVTSRAFASLATFADLTRQQLSPGGVWAAMKGKRPVGELAQLPADIDVFHVEQLDVPNLDAERCLVWMRPRR